MSAEKLLSLINKGTLLCIYKPPELDNFKIVANRLRSLLNCSLPKRQLRYYYNPDNSSHGSCNVSVDRASFGEVLGPKLNCRDISLTLYHTLPKYASGVQLIGINHVPGRNQLNEFMYYSCDCTYEVSVKLGKCTFDGVLSRYNKPGNLSRRKLTSVSDYGHVRRNSILEAISSIECYHRSMLNWMYSLNKGTSKDGHPPALFESIELVSLQMPSLTLRIKTRAPASHIPAVITKELATNRLKTDACVTKLRRTDIDGVFTVTTALILSNSDEVLIDGLLQNARNCSQILRYLAVKRSDERLQNLRDEYREYFS
ncbi:hypothetical protein GJ496_010567 [Pomphorhynchus laevis]|nr:hypothetical protein GJ496_010567 [Pomphorhynchus laevis]